jgi:hypothetical protein
MLEDLAHPNPSVHNQNVHIVGLLLLTILSIVLTFEGDHLVFVEPAERFPALLLAFPTALVYLLTGSRPMTNLFLFCAYSAVLAVGFLAGSQWYSRYIGTPMRIRQMVEESELQAELKERFTQMVRRRKGQ